MRKVYPQLLSTIKTKMTATAVLREKLSYVKKTASAGLIEEREASQLVEIIEEKLNTLERFIPNMEVIDSKDLLHSNPLFIELNRDEFDT